MMTYDVVITVIKVAICVYFIGKFLHENWIFGAE